MMTEVRDTRLYVDQRGAQRSDPHSGPVSEQDLLRPGHQPAGDRAVRSDVPNGTYYYATGAGHFMHAEQPELFAELVTDFLN